MWAITQKDHVTERVTRFIEEAEATIHYLVPATEVVDQRILDSLESAADRGVRVSVEVPTEDARETFAAAPTADVVVAPDLETTNTAHEEWPAQLLMADQEAIVAAGIKESDLPDVVNEMAVWTYGRDHGFAVWTRELLDDRLEEGDEDRTADG
jgi:sugar-specific transcriptional regulator TrmB